MGISFNGWALAHVSARAFAEADEGLRCGIKEHRVWKETAALPEKNGKIGKAEALKNGLTTNGEEKGSGKAQQEKSEDTN